MHLEIVFRNISWNDLRLSRSHVGEHVQEAYFSDASASLKKIPETIETTDFCTCSLQSSHLTIDLS